ncbi:MAG: oxygen-independent coproporphyrinogen III oxidase [Comamonas sp.]|nr:oxygen-independent coproporphyrinogen III oxidase [Comamonas sp.]
MPTITPELISRFDVPGPRYTSYPTADRFVEAFGEEDYLYALAQRQMGTSLAAQPLSLYVHLPFCESLCYYCACNKIITKHHERAAPYLGYVERELDLHVRHLGGPGQGVSQLHFGGGTPTFLSDEELGGLMDMLRKRFAFAPKGEYSIEIDPRTISAERLQVIRELGFNRLSFGVQDFDPEVQKAVHRVQPAEQVFALVAAAREIGFDSINVDLIYGLPKQTPESFARTIAQVVQLRPDRIALYAYAHLPARVKSQRHIKTDDIPVANNKVKMLSHSIAAFEAVGYVYIGMDHFALPDDSLAVAKRQGRLHRNFQGYSTQPDCDLISLGISAIGKVGATYSQNAKDLLQYQDLIDHGHLPIVRGVALSRDDVLRRAVINALMCQGSVQFESVEAAHLIDFRTTFASELARLRSMHDDGLVHLTADSIDVTPMGWFFVRGIAMVFDKYLQAQESRAQYSKIL